MKTNMDCDRCDSQKVCCSQRVLVTAMEARMLDLGTEEFYINPENQVCQFLSHGRCLVYSKRPRSCREFNCCNPDQVTIRGGVCSPEALQILKSSIEPKHWVHCELERRKKNNK